MENKPISRDELMKLLGEFKYVKSMDSKKGAGKIGNQRIIYFNNGCLYQSYDSDVAAFVNGQLYVNEKYHDYSNTTMKYCKEFTGSSVEQRRIGIAVGTIKTFE